MSHWLVNREWCVINWHNQILDTSNDPTNNSQEPQIIPLVPFTYPHTVWTWYQSGITSWIHISTTKNPFHIFLSHFVSAHSDAALPFESYSEMPRSQVFILTSTRNKPNTPSNPWKLLSDLFQLHPCPFCTRYVYDSTSFLLLMILQHGRHPVFHNHHKQSTIKNVSKLSTQFSCLYIPPHSLPPLCIEIYLHPPVNQWVNWPYILQSWVHSSLNGQLPASEPQWSVTKLRKCFLRSLNLKRAWSRLSDLHLVPDGLTPMEKPGIQHILNPSCGAQHLLGQLPMWHWAQWEYCICHFESPRAPSHPLYIPLYHIVFPLFYQPIESFLKGSIGFSTIDVSVIPPDCPPQELVFFTNLTCSLFFLSNTWAWIGLTIQKMEILGIEECTHPKLRGVYCIRRKQVFDRQCMWFFSLLNIANPSGDSERLHYEHRLFGQAYLRGDHRQFVLVMPCTLYRTVAKKSSDHFLDKIVQVFYVGSVGQRPLDGCQALWGSEGLWKWHLWLQHPPLLHNVYSDGIEMLIGWWL